MYEGMRDAIRAACNVDIVSWVQDETQEAIINVERYGQMLRTFRASRYVLVEANAVDEFKHKAFDAANEIVDEILEEVDWDRFFPVGWLVFADGEEREIPRLMSPKEFMGFTTYPLLKTGDQRRQSYPCAKVIRCEEHAPHDWMFQPEDDSPETVDAFCLGYYSFSPKEI